MNKAEVVSKISAQTGIHKYDVQAVVENMLQVIQQAMIEGEEVHFKGFGRFFNKKRSQKIGRNLANNTAITIKAHYVPTLKISKDFINKIKETVKV